MWQHYFVPTTIDEALELLAAQPGAARAVAGGTDLVIEVDRGVRRPEALVDITRIPGLDMIELRDDGRIQLGALVTHNQVVASELCVARALPLAQACIEVGAPQIRNRGTVAGNLITASPANDTITPLIALDADVTLSSKRGSRVVALRDFYTGVRRTVLEPDELLVAISFAPLASDEHGLFLKLGLRRAQAIAVVNVALVLGLPGGTAAPATNARIALGSVAPTIVRAAEAESFLEHRALDAATIADAAALAERAARPIDDVRGPASYRRGMVAGLVGRALQLLAVGAERQSWPERPVLLRTENQGSGVRGQGSGRQGDKACPEWERGETRRQGLPRVGTKGDKEIGDDAAVTQNSKLKTQNYPPPQSPIPNPQSPIPNPQSSVLSPQSSAIETTINGAPATLRGAHDMTLLDALRDVAGLTGTKKGCAEGECGSCTVWLNGAAVMSCLTPAGQAHGAEIVTIEGLAQDGRLHPVQRAFVEKGAVQCGYCTPGLIMAAAKLLEERPHPTVADAQQAVAGNLCRCTGYSKVIEAIVGRDEAANGA